MNIEEQITIVKNMLLHAETQLLDYEAIAIETLLTAYEKEKEKNKELEDALKQTQNSWYEDTKVIEKQSKEIEHQIEKRANQKKELAILNAKQVEFNKLVNTVNSYKGQFKKQQKEIEELKEDKYGLEEEVQMQAKNIMLCEEALCEMQDKIKAKIEELNKEMLNEENSLELFYRKKYCKDVLQSLLEKE